MEIFLSLLPRFLNVFLMIFVKHQAVSLIPKDNSVKLLFKLFLLKIRNFSDIVFLWPFLQSILFFLFDPSHLIQDYSTFLTGKACLKIYPFMSVFKSNIVIIDPFQSPSCNSKGPKTEPPFRGHPRNQGKCPLNGGWDAV